MHGKLFKTRFSPRSFRLVWQWLLSLSLGLGSAVVAAAEYRLPPLASYAAMAAMEDVALTNSGKYLAFSGVIDGNTVVALAETGGKVLHRVGLGNIKLRGLHWAGDDYLIIRTSSTQNLGMYYGGRYELFNFIVVERKTGKSSWPLHDSGRVMNAAFGMYLPVNVAGRWSQCVGTLPLEKSRSGAVWLGDGIVDLSCFDLASGEVKKLTDGRKDGDGWLLSPEGEVAATALNDADKQRWALKAASGRDGMVLKAPVLAEHSSRYGDSAILGFGRSPDTVLYAVTDERGSSRVMERRLDGATEAVALYANILTHDLLFDPVSRLHIGYWKEGLHPELVMLDPKAQARVEATRKAFPGSRVHFSAFSGDLDRMVVLTEGDDDSGTWWLVDIAQGSADILGQNFPQISASQVGPVREWRYQAADGLEIEAIVTEPPTGLKDNMALVVLPHGGPQSKDRLGFDWLAQAFASRGYLVLQPNFRGSSGYGVAFRNAGFGQWGRKMQTDLSDGVTALVKAGRVDPDKVCIVGASYGGYAALAGVTLQSGVYRCAVAIAGVADPAAMLKDSDLNESANARRYWRDFMGVKGAFYGGVDDISPYRRAAQASAPILLLHGDDDLVVPFDQSKRMAKQLKREDKPYKLVKLKKEDHWLTRLESRRQVLEETVGFLLEHNPPGELTPVAQ